MCKQKVMFLYTCLGGRKGIKSKFRVLINWVDNENVEGKGKKISEYICFSLYIDLHWHVVPR